MLSDQTLPQELPLQLPALCHQHTTQRRRAPGGHPRAHASPERQAARRCQPSSVGVSVKIAARQCRVCDKRTSYMVWQAPYMLF